MDKREIDRLPTTLEKIVGIAASIFLALATGVICYFCALGMIKAEESITFIVVFCVCFLFFIYAVRTLFRAMFTKPEKLSGKATLIVNRSIFVMSIFLLILGLFPFSSDLTSRMYCISVGLTGLAYTFEVIQNGKISS